MLLREAIEVWTDRLASTHMPSTITAYRKDALRFVEWREDSMTEMDVVILEDYDDHLRRDGVSVSARQRAFYALSSLISYLRRHGHPITGMEPSHPRGRVPRRDAIPSSVLDGIVTGEKDPMHRAFLVTLAGTGARLGEVLSLDASKVDLEEGVIEISGEKDSGARTIPLSAFTVEALRDYILDDRRPPKSGDPLFVTRVGSRMSERTARTIWKQALERVGASGFCMHQVRHRYATDVVARGGLDVGQALLGHRSPSSVLRYSHPSMDRLRDAVMEVKR